MTNNHIDPACKSQGTALTHPSHSNSTLYAASAECVIDVHHHADPHLSPLSGQADGPALAALKGRQHGLLLALSEVVSPTQEDTTLHPRQGEPGVQTPCPSAWLGKGQLETSVSRAWQKDAHVFQQETHLTENCKPSWDATNYYWLTWDTAGLSRKRA